MTFGLTPKQVAQIRGILAQYPSISQAVVFGSRAMGNYRETSDMDLALKGAVDLSVVAQVKYALEEETNLPYFFDVIAYNTIDNANLKEHIDTHGLTLYQADPKPLIPYVPFFS